MITTASETNSKAGRLPEPSEGVEWLVLVQKSGCVASVLAPVSTLESVPSRTRGGAVCAAIVLRPAELHSLSCCAHGASTLSTTEAGYARLPSDRKKSTFSANAEAGRRNFRNKHKRHRPRPWMPLSFRELWMLAFGPDTKNGIPEILHDNAAMKNAIFSAMRVLRPERYKCARNTCFAHRSTR